jgi:hypothetical protein
MGAPCTCRQFLENLPNGDAKKPKKPKSPTYRNLIRKDVGTFESYIAATLVW